MKIAKAAVRALKTQEIFPVTRASQIFIFRVKVFRARQHSIAFERAVCRLLFEKKSTACEKLLKIKWDIRRLVKWMTLNLIL